ncbi:MAG TPA: putative metallopeptidase [archaeon]|nr:putative metallopeptidase [archaeon]
MIKYHPAADIQEKMLHVAEKLGMKHDFSRIICIRSHGSASRRTLARCYALPRVMQVALGIKPHYVIEVISERYDRLSEAEKTKVIIHELMHIPKSFGGGFRYHDHVSRRNVEEMYKRYVR